MAYTVHQAKTHFSKLLREAEAGQEVVVMRGKTPVVKLVPIKAPVNSRRALAGAYRDRISWSEDAFAPLSDEELDEMGFGRSLEEPAEPNADK